MNETSGRFRHKAAFSKHVSPFLAFALSCWFCPQVAESGNTWTGGGSTTNWNDDGNWGGSQPTYGTLTFDTGGIQGTTSVVNQAYSMNSLLWTGTSTWVVNNSGGFGISLFDNGGAQAKIENQSTGLVTVNAPITFAATTGAAWGEINAVNGDLTFGTAGTITASGSIVNELRFYGSGRTVTINSAISAGAKKLIIGPNTTDNNTIILNAANSYSGNTEINVGSVQVGNNTGLGTSTVYLGNGGATFSSSNSTLLLNTSGLTVSNAITTNKADTGAGLGTGIRTIGGNFTSGTSAFSGPIALNGGAVLTAGSGGTVNFTGIISNGTDTGNISRAITINAPGGTVGLTNANTYSGKTSVLGGTLAIASDTGLGTAPGAAVADQLTLNGGALRITAGNQTLALNRGITLGASGGTIDADALADSANFTTTVAGKITGTGALLLKSNGDQSSNGGGSSTLGIYLTNAANDFTGDITISSGLVSYVTNSAFGNAANKIILTGGGLLDNSTNIALSRAIVLQSGTSTFRTYGSSNVTWSSTITGSGAVNRTDGGTLTLSGDLSGFSGTYNNQGGNTNLTGTVATIGGNWNLTSALTINSSANQALAGNISGAGQLTKSGNGTLTLSGNNSAMTGGTNANGGVLSVSNIADTGTSSQIGNWTTGGNPFLGIANGGTFRYTGTAAATTARNLWVDTGVGGTIDVSDVAGSLTFTGTGGNLTQRVTKVGLGTLTIDDVINGTTGAVTVTAGTFNLRGINTYTGTTVINGGTLVLTGATGAITSATATTIATGGTLKIDNSTASVADRFGAGAITLSGGTLDYFHGGAAGTNYSETLGVVSVVSGGSTITTAQAALGQTSILTLGGLIGTPNFTGTGLGMDARNRVIITGKTTGAMVGLFNTTGIAIYDTTLGVTEAIVTDVPFAGTIADAAASNIRLTGGTSGNIVLAVTPTTVNNILQNQTSATTIDNAAQILRLGAVGGILIPASKASLTIGAVANSGTLTAGGAADSVGTLNLTNSDGTSMLTINSVIANNGSGVVGVVTSGIGKVILAGTNTYTGTTVLGAATTEISGASLTLSGAISGAGALLKTNAGSTLTLTGPSTFTGATTVSAGTIAATVNTTLNALGSSAIAISSGATMQFNNTNTSGTGVTIGNAFTGSGLLKLNFAAGVTATGTAMNNVTGFTGTIQLSSTGATGDKWGLAGLGTINAALIIDSGSQLFSSAGTTTFSNGITLSGTGNNENRGAIRLIGTVGGNVSLAGSATIGTENGTMTGNISSGAAGTQTLTFAGAANGAGTFTGNIGGGTGTIAVAKNTSGLVTLSGNNSYSGGTTVSSGELRASLGTTAGAKSVLGASLVTANNGTTLRFLAGSTPNAMSNGNNIAMNGATFISEDAVQTYSGSLTLTGTNSLQVVYATKNAIWSGPISGPGIFNKSGAGTLVLSGANTSFTSASSVAGPLTLDYATNDNRKISSGALTLSSGTIELTGGTFADSVASTTLTASMANTVTRSSGTATLDLGAITRNAASFLNFGQSGIARTSNPNVNGILGTWATIGGSQWAMNNGSGLIIAATTTDLTRLSSGTKTIADGAASHIRLVEGTGSAGSILLGSAITTINTLVQSSEGGVSAATIDPVGQTLALNVVMVGTGAGGLTIGTGTNNGTIKAAGTAIEFRDLAAAGITVNSVIADGTGATSLTKNDAGTLTFSGANTYTGGTTVNAGMLTASLGTTAGARTIFGTGAITANSGTTLRFFAGSTGNAMSHANAINLNSATLTSEDANQTFSGNIALTGANTVNVTYDNKSAIFSGVVNGAGSLNKASAGVLTLSGNNSYTGGTTISAGTLKTANTAALGAAGQTLTLNGGTLQLATDAPISSKNVTMGGNATFILDRNTFGTGFATTFGSLTSTAGDYTLTFNKGSNVADSATINFGGTLSITGRTTTFNTGAGTVVQLGAIATGAQTVTLTKSGAGTLIIPADYGTWDGGGNTTLSGGTLELRGIMGDSGVFRSLVGSAGSTLRLANDSSKNFYSGITASAGMNIEAARVTSSATPISHELGTLSFGGTLNVTRGTTITGSGVGTIAFNGATTLTSAATINVGSNAVLNLGAISGNFTLTKSGLGSLSIFGSSSSTGAITLNGGTTNLMGAFGTVATSTGITLNNGAVLTINNTSAANNTDRIAGTFAINGGTFNFTNNAGAVNYAETTGALSIGAGTNTIATSQAASGQTSILTFASLARTAGTLNFSGTGLGTTVDTKNEIRFTTNPTLVSGLIGTWATVNGTDFATTTGANNSVIAYNAYTDVTRLESGTKIIANVAANNVRIIEGTGVAPANITLGAANTTINTLNQSASGGTSGATIDPAGQIFALNSILVGSGAGGLTIGNGTNNGTLKPSGTSLQVTENSTGGSTINSVIADGTAASSFTKSGTGTLTLSGTNTYTGVTTIEGGVLAVAVMANGGSNSGIGAAAVAQGNLVLANGTLRYTGSTVSSNRGFTINAGTTGTVDVSASGQTLTFSGGLAGTTGNFNKAGAGNLTFSTALAHAGLTSVTGGKLTISSTALNSSGFSAGPGATLEFGATNIFVGGHGTALDNARVISIDGGTLLFNASADFRFGNVTLSNGATWTSNRNLAAYDALLANTTTGAATVTVSGTGASTMNGTGGIHLQGMQNFNVSDVTASTAVDLTVSMIIGAQGTIAGAAGGINKQGLGTMLLSGANAFTGSVVVTSGVIQVGNASALGVADTSASKVTVGSGATVDFNGQVDATYGYTIAGTGLGGNGALVNNGATIDNGFKQASNITLSADASIGGTGSWALLTTGSGLTNLDLAGFTLTKSGSNTVTLVNSAITAGNILIAGGSLATATNASTGTSTALTLNNTAGVALSLGANLTVGSLAGGGTTGGNLSLGGSTLTLGALNTSTNYSGAITSAAGGNIVKNGTGSFTISQATGTVDVKGGITVNGGGLVMNAAASWPTYSGGPITLNNGSSLLISGGRYDFSATTFAFGSTGGSTITSNSSTNWVGQGGNRAFTTAGGAKNTVGGTGWMNTNGVNTTFTVVRGSDASSDLDFNIPIGNTSYIESVTKAGNGILTLTAANTYKGATNITGGKLMLTGVGSLSDSSVVNLSAGTVFDIAGISSSSETIAALTGASTSLVTLGAKTLDVGSDNTSFAFDGVASGDGGSVKKSGSGTLTIRGSSTYTGTTNLSAGTLLLGNSDTLPNGAAFTLSGATKLSTGGFDDATGAFTLGGSAIIDMGNSNSILSFTDISAWTGTLSVWNWTGSLRTGGGTDQLLFTGSKTPINLANVNFYSGDDTGSPLGGGGAIFDGNELVPVPEPGALLVGLLLVGSICHHRRPRRA